MKIYFATDVHGSEICWKKFLAAYKFYEADALILGGDLTGKAIVPIIDQGAGKHKVTLLDQETILEGQEQIDAILQTRERPVGENVFYPYHLTGAENRVPIG